MTNRLFKMEEKFARQAERFHERPCRACVDLSGMFKKSKISSKETQKQHVQFFFRSQV